MKFKLFVLAMLLSASAIASTNLPPGAPLTLPAPPGQSPRDGTGLIFSTLVVKYSTCLAFYVYSHSRVDPYDAHVWVLQRFTYDNGYWENLSTKVAPITSQDKAFFMFSDRIDRDGSNGNSVAYYRVVDMGSYTP